MAPRTADKRKATRPADALAGRGFERLVRKYHERVWRLVWRLVRHSGQADEVVRQVFTDLRREHPELCEGRQLAIRLYRIAVERSAELLEPSTTRHAGNSRATRSADREESLLDSCLQSLSVTLRTPLCLKLEGLSYEEIADTLTLSVDTVRTRVFLARDAVARSVSRKRARDDT